MSGCVILNCPAYKNGKCMDEREYIDRLTGQPTCPFHPNAVAAHPPAPKTPDDANTISKEGMEHLESIAISDNARRIGVIDIYAADAEKGALLGGLLSAAPQLYIAARIVYTYLTHTTEDATSLYEICKMLRDAIDAAEMSMPPEEDDDAEDTEDCEG